MMTLTTCVLSLRAASICEDLAKVGITATTFQPKWTNKRLPPPRIEVRVAAADLDRAKAALASASRG